MNNNLLIRSNNLKENQVLAAQLLASGNTGRAVAEQINVAEETISRWRLLPEFQLYLSELMIAANENARVKLQSLISKTVDNIENALNDNTLSPKDKFIASIKVLELCSGFDWALREKVKQFHSL